MVLKRKAWEVRLEQRLDEDEGGPGSFNLWCIRWRSLYIYFIYTDIFPHPFLGVIIGRCRLLFLHSILFFYFYGDKHFIGNLVAQTVCANSKMFHTVSTH